MFGSSRHHTETPTRMKTVLVIGGAGFIGAHLCEQLVGAARVICVDDFATGSAQNIEALRTHPHFEFINHDITQPLDLASLRELAPWHIRPHGVQEVYMLACPESRAHFESSKVAAACIHSVGVKQALDLAVRHGARFVYGSTGALYGPRRHGKGPVAEKDGCHVDHLTPRGMADEGHRFAEALAHTYADVYGLSVGVARIFRTYGTRMRQNDGAIIPDMVAAALQGEDIILPGNEETRVSLCDVSDIVHGLQRLMEAPFSPVVVNLGSDEEIPLLQVAEQIRQLADASSHIRFEPASPWFLEDATPNITRARDMLGWSPRVRLPHGLRRMLEE